MKQKLIAQGAEAKIYLIDKKIVKDRIPKSYRLPELDEKIRRRRTKSEAKLLTKASKVINCPAPLAEPGQGRMIHMPFIDGKKLSEHLDNFPKKEQLEICKKIGESVSKIHRENLIHGDLTTSNMIWVKDDVQLNLKGKSDNTSKKNIQIITSPAKDSNEAESGAIKSATNWSVFFIDFGLGFQNGKYEDKAVDLHVLKQALEAKHFSNWEELWKTVEKSYLSIKKADAKKVLERLKAVEKRGRYKH